MTGKSLIDCDFAELERRVMAWDGWHEGPITQNGFPPEVSPTGRMSVLSEPEPQYLARKAESGVTSRLSPNQTEDKP